MKTLILIFLSALLFLGNIGVPVFKHACDKNGVYTSFFIQQQSQCPEEQSDIPSCCQKEKKKSCCHDEKTVLQLDEKYVSTQALVVPIVYLQLNPNNPSFHFATRFSSEEISVKAWDDPPPTRKFGRELLIHQCVFRI